MRYYQQFQRQMNALLAEAKDHLNQEDPSGDLESLFLDELVSLGWTVTSTGEHTVYLSYDPYGDRPPTLLDRLEKIREEDEELKRREGTDL